MEHKKVLIMAGGTGGHVFPGLALSEELFGRGYCVNWLGTRHGIESTLVPAAKIPLYFIPVQGLRGKGLRTLLMAPWTITCSIYSAVSVIRQLKPCLAVGMGGFVSGPGGIAAKILGIPLVIHEQNAVAGTTNKILAKISRRILLAFPGTIKNGVCIGNPVRKEIDALTPPEERLKKRSGAIRLLIIGGSRGALAINELVPSALGLISKNTAINVWHQAGQGKDQATRLAYKKLGIQAKVEPFIDNMAVAFSWADFVVCRSGALTVSELASVGLGSLLIPFPHAIDDHQTKNAAFLEQSGAAMVIQQDQLTAEKLAALFENLLPDRKKLVDMACRAKSLVKPKCVQVFADQCEAAIDD